MAQNTAAPPTTCSSHLKPKPHLKPEQHSVVGGQFHAFISACSCATSQILGPTSSGIHSSLQAPCPQHTSERWALPLGQCQPRPCNWREICSILLMSLHTTCLRPPFRSFFFANTAKPPPLKVIYIRAVAPFLQAGAQSRIKNNGWSKHHYQSVTLFVIAGEKQIMHTTVLSAHGKTGVRSKRKTQSVKRFMGRDSVGGGGAVNTGH